MRREREASRTPPVRAAQASLAASVSVRRSELLSPAGLQRRFGNQGAQLVVQAVASRNPLAPQLRVATPRNDTGTARPAAGPQPARAESGSAAVEAAAPVAAAGASAPAAEAAPAAGPAQAAQPIEPDAAAAAAAVEAAGGPIAKGAAAEAGGKGGAPGEAAAAPSAAQAVAPVAAQVRKRAGKARTHSTAGPAQEHAQAAGKNPKTERTRDAARATVIAIEGAKTQPVESFRDKLRKALKDTLPKPTNAAEAKRAKERGAADANAALSAEMGKQTDETTGGLPAAANPASEVQADNLPGPPEVTLVPEEAGPSPAPVAAGPAVPEPAAPPDLSEDRAETDRAMADAGVTKAQMAKSNEPEFTATLQAREDAEKEEAQRAQEFEAGQKGILTKQHGQTAAMLSGGLETIHGSRTAGLGLVAGTQTTTQTAESRERERITGIVKGIKDKTREDVLQMLADMEASATTCFRGGLELAEKAYENAFEEHKGGAWNWLTNWGDDWEELIEKAFVVGRREYNRIVDQTIDDVAFIIENRLALAKMRVERGRRDVDDFVDGLDGESKRYGDEARIQIASDFEAMDGEIDAKRDEIVTKLVDQYRESQKRVSELEEKLRAANKSLWQRIYDATVGIIKKIIAFKDFLLNVLARVAQVVSAIIDDPIGFLGNLIDGIIAGLDRFKSNIGAHLKKGLLEWLFGALEGAGIKLPETFDLKGIVGLVLQILGLTWENIRARAVKVLGADVVSYLETSWEIFQVLIKEGPAGLWKMLVEKVGDIKEMILTQVGEFVKEKIIFAGIKWVLSLLNPVAAFIKACMAIYDIVKFFIERAEQIAALISAILDTLGAIVKGNLSAMATAVENALARLIPVAIGFLASLLNLGGISDKIRHVIMKLRQPVNAAIDWIIGKAAALVKKGIGFLTKKADAAVNKVIKATDKRTPEEKQRDLDRAAKSLRPVVQALLKRGVTPKQLKPLLLAWRLRYRLNSLTLEDGEIVARINPQVTIGKGWTFEAELLFNVVDEVAADFIAEAQQEAEAFPTDDKAKRRRVDREGKEEDVEVEAIDMSGSRQLGSGARRMRTKQPQEIRVGGEAGDPDYTLGHTVEQRVFGPRAFWGIGQGGAFGQRGTRYPELEEALRGQPVGEWMATRLRTGQFPPEAAAHKKPLGELYVLMFMKEPSQSHGRHQRDLVYSAMSTDLMTGPSAMPLGEVVGAEGIHPSAFGRAQMGAQIVTSRMDLIAKGGERSGKRKSGHDLRKLRKKEKEAFLERVGREGALLKAWFEKHKDKWPLLGEKPTLADIKVWVRDRIKEFLAGADGPKTPHVPAEVPEQAGNDSGNG